MGINEEFKNIEVRLRRLESNVRELVRRGRNEPTGVLAPDETTRQIEEFEARKYRQERDEARGFATAQYRLRLEVAKKRDEEKDRATKLAVMLDDTVLVLEKCRSEKAQALRERDAARSQLRQSAELLEKFKGALKAIYLREVPDLDLGVTVARWMREVAHEAVQDLEKQHGL